MENYPTITEKDWGKFFMHLYKNTQEGFTFEKWYKTIHLSLPLNKKLYQMKRRDSPLCPKCGRQEETHHHLIYYCQATEDIRIFIENLIMDTYHNIFYDLTLEHIIMGAVPPIIDDIKLEILPTLLEIYYRSVIEMRLVAEKTKKYSFAMEFRNFKQILVAKLKQLKEISKIEKHFDKFKNIWRVLLDKNENINIRFA